MANQISKLEKNRSLFFKTGLVIAMAMSLAAFNYTTYPERPIPEDSEGMHIDKTVEIIRTAREKPKPLPPPPSLEMDIAIPPVSPDTPKPKPISKPIAISDSGKGKISDFISQNFADAQKATLPPAPPPPPRPKPDKPIIFAERMPRFVECNTSKSYQERQVCAEVALLKYIQGEIRYPALAREVSISGTVVIRFVVRKDGSISDAEILKDIGGGCGAEALRVVESMDNWIPGKQQGRPVSVYFNLPIKFQLQ